MKYKIAHINYKLVWIFILFESIALFFFSLFNVNTSTTENLLSKGIYGIIIGFITAILTLLIINYFLSKRKHKLKYKTKKIQKISLMVPSLTNALFLGILFVIESIISPIKQLNIIWGNMIVGGITVPLSIFIVLKIYNLQKNKIYFNAGKKYFIKKISVWNIVIFAALYEIIVLPIMALLIKYFYFIQKELTFSIIGILAGTTSLLTIFIYNKLLKKRKIYFSIST